MILWIGSGAGSGIVELVAGDAYPDWCDRCMTSGAVRIRFYVLEENGPRWVGLAWACVTCDPDKFNDAGGDGDTLVPA